MAIKFEFFVPGICRTSGSKKPFTTKYGRKLVPDGKFQKSWQDSVAWHFMQEFARPVPIDGAVELQCIFVMKRPKAHYKTHKGLRTAQIKPTAPNFHISRPDAGKLRRAVEDALSGLAYNDDSQICVGVDTKIYTNAEQPTPGVEITITELEAD